MFITRIHLTFRTKMKRISGNVDIVCCYWCSLLCRLHAQDVYWGRWGWRTRLTSKLPLFCCRSVVHLLIYIAWLIEIQVPARPHKDFEILRLICLLLRLMLGEAITGIKQGHKFNARLMKPVPPLQVHQNWEYWRKCHLAHPPVRKSEIMRQNKWKHLFGWT